ncbi:MAG: CoA-acylating methylmalonate-semialdehyde dehydrogenase [Alphaproteobacteria bacterium]
MSVNLGHIIEGKRIIESSNSPIKVFNPSNGKVISTISNASQKTINKALNSSQRAFDEWKNFSIAKRTSILFEYKILLEKNINKIANIISKDLGKVHDDAVGEVRRGIDNVEYACGIGEIMKGEFNKNISTSIDSWSEFSPLGPVLGITPFNFPAMVPLWMFPLALATGNSFILKPSEKDPLGSMFIVELFSKTKAPKGLLNLLNGDKDVANELIRDKRIKAVSFVGSTPVAKKIYETAAVSGKRCQALGGAKNHALILPDADIDYTTDQLISAAFGSSGQRCMALSVAVVFSNIKEKFLKSLKTKTSKLKFGFDNLNSNSFGPLVSKEHLDSVKSYISMAKEEGSRIILDGRSLVKRKNSDSGYFLGPTLIDNVKTNMDSYKNEIFGPVLQIIEVNKMSEAIKIVNDNEFGNGCCIFTSNGESARNFSQNAQIGMVGVNIPLPVPSSYHSFGGWKNSLFGDLSIYGPDGVRFYTQRKTITQRWPNSSSKSGGIDLSMPNNLKQ